MIVAVFEVDVEGAAHADRFVRPDPVEELAVALGFDAELVAVVDLVAVEVLVLQRAEGAPASVALTVTGGNRFARAYRAAAQPLTVLLT